MNQFNLPKSFDEISYKQYLELIDIDIANLSFYTRYIEILSILSDLPTEDFEDMDIDDVGSLIKDIKWLKLEPSSIFKKELDNFTYKGLDNLTFGEFIDLEYFFSEDYIKNLPIICAILYRQTKKDEWDNIIFEPYSKINIYERMKRFSELPITSIYGVIKDYIEYKKKFYDTYQNLFEPNVEETDAKEEIPIEYDEQIQIQEEKKQSKWSYENIIHKLSNGDVTKYDLITDLPLIFVFNQLSYRKEMNIE